MAGEPSLLLAPVDADARELVDGQLACLRSEHGALTVPVHRSDDVLPGTAVLVSNWWNGDFPGGAGSERADGPGAHRRRRGTQVPGPRAPFAGLTRVREDRPGGDRRVMP